MPKFRFSMSKDDDGKPTETEITMTLPDGTEGKLMIAKNRITAEIEGDNPDIKGVFDWIQREFPGWFPGLNE